MSRFAIALSLVAALTTSALAAPTFATPPPAHVGVTESVTAPEAMRVALDRRAVRAKLLANRKANLERFRAYQAKRVFPMNLYIPGPLNVWQDREGNFCAAATIILQSGNRALVEQIAAEDNFIRLGDVTEGPVMDWMLTSGLTQQEIAAIQAPFFMEGDREGAWPLITIDPQQREQETVRLAKIYKQVTSDLVKNQTRSLEAAVDRLMQDEELAWTLLAS